jgi:hypothetical protein
MARSTDPTRPDFAAGRRIAGHAQDDHILDPYQRQAKLSEPTACPRCGATYHLGRWQWTPAPPDAHAELCPACRRIEDEFPAGSVTIGGAFARDHKDEIVNLMRHQEAAEKGEHPLNRIIAIAEEGDRLVVTTTDIHLPRRIGEALERAFGGAVNFHFDRNGYFARVTWEREA